MLVNIMPKPEVGGLAERSADAFTASRMLKITSKFNII
jgi:hypothetical protein